MIFNYQYMHKFGPQGSSYCYSKTSGLMFWLGTLYKQFDIHLKVFLKSDVTVFHDFPFRRGLVLQIPRTMSKLHQYTQCTK